MTERETTRGTVEATRVTPESQVTNRQRTEVRTQIVAESHRP